MEVRVGALCFFVVLLVLAFTDSTLAQQSQTNSTIPVIGDAYSWAQAEINAIALDEEKRWMYVGTRGSPAQAFAVDISNPNSLVITAKTTFLLDQNVRQISAVALDTRPTKRFAYMLSATTKMAVRLGLDSLAIQTTLPAFPGQSQSQPLYELPFGASAINYAWVDPVGECLYTIGNAEGFSRFIKVPLILWDKQPWTNVTTDLTYDTLDLTTSDAGGYIISGSIDSANQIAYLGSDGISPLVFQVNMTTMKIMQTIALDPTKGSILAGGFFDPERNNVYFFTRSPNSGFIIKVNGGDFNASKVSYLRTASFDRMSNGVADFEYGHAYFGTDSSPALLIRINLAKFIVENVLKLSSNFSRTQAIAVDPITQTAYMAPSIVSSTGNTAKLLQVLLPTPCTLNCNNKGYCRYATCICDGPTVNITDGNYPNVTNENGTINGTAAAAVFGWHGETCDLIRCPNDCSCVNGTCNGVCGNGTCVCDPIHAGLDCSIRQCPRRCSGHGKCDNTTYVCTCARGWTGDDCSVSRIPECWVLDTCTDCLSNSSCGWCGSDDKCYVGGIEGPTNGGCYEWYYDRCPAYVIQAFGWFFTLIGVIFLLINAVSLCMEDMRRSPETERTVKFVQKSNYRAIRSGKSWLYIEQLQFVGMTGLFTSAPSLYISWTKSFDWTLLGFQPLWGHDPVDQDYERKYSLGLLEPETRSLSTRSLLSFPQHDSILETHDDQLFLATLFWFAILLCIVVIIYGVMALLSLVIPNDNFKKHSRNRLIYNLIRAVLFSYQGLVVTAASFLILPGDFTTGDDDGVIFGYVVCLLFTIIFILGTPALVFGFLFRKTKQLFQKDFIMRFSCLYNNFKFKQTFWATVMLVRRLIIGATIGFLMYHEIGVLVILFFVIIAYIVALIVVRPHVDMFHIIVEVAVWVLNLVVVILMFAFIEEVEDDTAKLGVMITIFLLQVLSFLFIIASFIHSWIRMERIFSCRQFWMWLTCRGGGDNSSSGLSASADKDDI